MAQCYLARVGMVRPGMAWLWVAVLGTLSLVFVGTLNIYLPQSSAAEVGVQADLAAASPPLDNGWLHCCFPLTMGLLAIFGFQVPDQLLVG